MAAKHFIETARLTGELEHTFFGQSDQLAPRSRSRYAWAIHVVSRHMDIIGVPAKITAEFQELASALDDLDDGVVHPMLEKRDPKGSPRLRAEIWRARAPVAAAVSLLMSDGMLKTAACQRIAKEFPQLGAPPLCKEKPTSPDALAKSIGEWHKAFAGGDVPEGVAQAMFNNRAELFKSQSAFDRTDDKAAIARSILRFAVEIASRCRIEPAPVEKMGG